MKKIPLTKPYFDLREEKAVAEVLRSGWVTQGPKVAEFEKMMASYTGAKYAVATTSATTALFLSLYMLGVGRGDEVIVPSFSFIASTNVIVHTGATPVFIDIDPKTYNIDPEKIEKAINAKTKAILPVDQLGLPCEMDKIVKISKKYSLFIIEDAACGLGSAYKGKKVGSYPGIDVACFSFHPRKAITTGEGGMITTSNKLLAQKACILRHHGMLTSDLERHNSKKITREKYSEVGFNFRMSDIQAAVGIEQMKKLNLLLKKRSLVAKRYNDAFSKNKLITPPYVPKGYIHNWQSYIIMLKKNKKLTRDDLMQKLLDRGISTRRGVMASHLETPYKKIAKNQDLSITEQATAKTICLPIYPQMTISEQNYVIKSIQQIVE